MRQPEAASVGGVAEATSEVEEAGLCERVPLPLLVHAQQTRRVRAWQQRRGRERREARLGAPSAPLPEVSEEEQAPHSAPRSGSPLIPEPSPLVRETRGTACGCVVSVSCSRLANMPVQRAGAVLGACFRLPIQCLSDGCPSTLLSVRMPRVAGSGIAPPGFAAPRRAALARSRRDDDGTHDAPTPDGRRATCLERPVLRSRCCCTAAPSPPHGPLLVA